MTSRRAVTDTLQRLAFALELLDGDARQTRTFSSAAWALRSLDGDLGELLASGELVNVRGVGRSTLRIIEAVLDGRDVPLLTDLEARLPRGLLQVRRVRGLGPKKIKQLWLELQITSLAELEYACEENRLVDLKGFGAKTQAKVLGEVRRLAALEGQFTRDRVSEVVALLALPPETTHIVGAWRRGEPLVDGIDILCTAPLAIPPDLELPIRVHHATPENLGTQLILHTGPLPHVQALQALGWDASQPAATEAEVYRLLDLHTPPPERRHLPPVSITRPRRALVRLSDLRGALHNHTTASDGANTLEEMRDAAARLGLDYLGISEHSVSAAYAGGLSREALLAQQQTIRALNAAGHACTLLAGIESDILRDGELDYDDDALAQLDFVVASVHVRYAQTPEQMTRRMCAAARSPHTTLIGHPTGRLLLGRAPSEYDLGLFLSACREANTAVELNASPHRLDFGEDALAMARETGVLVSIGADAHSARALANLEHGIAIARRAGLTPYDVLNCRPLEALSESR